MLGTSATAARSLRALGCRSFSNTAGHYPNKASVNAKHWEKSWGKDQLVAESSEHVMATWGPGANIRGNPVLVKGEGIYLYDVDGNKYIDWTSQAVCSNLGHTMPDTVKNAMMHQASTLPFVYNGFCLTEPRIRLSSLLSELLPGDLTGFLFPTSGSEANEAAIRLARRFTGKTKIINQYRCYHGGTSSSLQATGDFRRNFNEGTGGSGAVGFVKTMNATGSPLFDFGATEAERSAKALAFLEEQIICEGPKTIAAVMMEPIVGGGGTYMNPAGYMEGVRALCDKYGILMICDEVLVGFGRTGKLWSFQHYGIHPDIVTSAKGLSSAWASISMVCVRQEIKDFFETNASGWGSTFMAHPISCAIAYENLKYILEHDVLGHVRDNVAPVIKSECERLAAKFPSVSNQTRAVGAFGCVDLLDPRTGKEVCDFVGSFNSHPDAVNTFKSKLRENGIFGLVRPPRFHVAPPLIITTDELKDGFARCEKALEVYDSMFK